MKWYLQAFKNFTDFDGRARRKEYWMFLLFNLIFNLAAIALDSELRSGGIVYLVYNLFTFIPHLALTIRRLHDVGRSGWFVLILFIPFIGVIGLLAQAIKDGEPGPNQYGPNPKETAFDVANG